MSVKQTRIQENVAKSQALGREMKKSADVVVDALGRASQKSAKRSAVSGRFVTVSGKTRSFD